MGDYWMVTTGWTYGSFSGSPYLYDHQSKPEDDSYYSLLVLLALQSQREPAICSFPELVSSLLAEKVQTLKSSSYKDLSSSLNTVSRFLPEDMYLMSRSECLAVRDAMLAAEVRQSTINKLLTDGAHGFDLKSFLSWVNTQSDEGQLFGMTPSAYSSWFNSRVLTEALPDAENVSLRVFET